MKPVVWLALILAVCGTLATAQNPASTSENTTQSVTPSPVAAGGIIPAELTKSLDAKKAKSGDRIEARTTVDMLAHGQIILPRNTKIVGHVTEAKAHAKDSPDSTLGIVFDQFQFKDGHATPAKLVVQAVGRPLQNFGADSMGESPGMMPTSAPRAGTMGGPTMGNPPTPPQGQYPGNAAGDPRDASNTPSPGMTTMAPLGPTSQGAVGMRGLTLSNGNPGAVLTSSSQNVHLDTGTQLILRTE